MNRITYLAGVLAVIAFPAFADKQPAPNPVWSEEKILLLLEQMQQDIRQIQQDLEEVRGDREEAGLPKPRSEKIK